MEKIIVTGSQYPKIKILDIALPKISAEEFAEALGVKPLIIEDKQEDENEC